MRVSSVQEALNGHSNDTVITPYTLNQVLDTLPSGEGGGGITEESDPIFKRSAAYGITSSDIENWNNTSGGSSFSGDYNDLTNKPDIPDSTSDLVNDSGFITSIPGEYVTESELNQKGFLTSIPGEYKTKSENDALYQPKGDYLTTIPEEYVTEEELNSKGYITQIPEESDPVFVNSPASDITDGDIDNWNAKQEPLVSGQNIKTINNESLLGSGNINIIGSGIGTSDYNTLNNLPSINGTTLLGNKTLDDLGIQPKGDYLTSVPEEYVNEEELEFEMTKQRVDILEAFTPVAVPIEFEDADFSGFCAYYPVLRLCYCRLYITGKAFATGTRHIVATIPEGYRPAVRIALAMDGLQDYASATKASITSAGEIGFTTSAAKESGDDQYIAGVWFVG